MGKRYIEWAKKAFEFYPGAKIEHRIERIGAFVTLVFGSSVLGILYQSGASFGINAFFGKAVLGLIQAFIFNWIYFEMDSWNLHQHAIRRHVGSGQSAPILVLPYPAFSSPPISPNFPLHLRTNTSQQWYGSPSTSPS